MLIPLHPHFRLNGRSCDEHILIEQAHQWSKSDAEWQREIGSFIQLWTNDQPFVECRTSGSTGTPKTIRLLKSYMIASALRTLQALWPGEFSYLQGVINAEGDQGKHAFKALETRNVCPLRRALLCIPARYIGGRMMIVRAMIAGFDLVVVKPGSDVLRHVEGFFNLCAMVPMQAASAVPELDRIENVLIGGGLMSADQQEMLRRRNNNIWHTYGMTETSSHIALRQVSPKLQTTYKALPDVALSTDEQGRLSITDAANPKAVTESVSGSALQTTDVVSLIDQWSFEWLGRADNVIISGGIKFYPEKIERALLGLTDRNFFISGTADAHLGNKLVLVLEGSRPGSVELSALLSFIDQRLTGYEKPRELRYLNTFVRTANGKLQRSESLDKSQLA